MTEAEYEKDVYFMRAALEQAKIAYSLGEVPVGAVIVKEGEIVSAAYNERETGKNALRHAELTAIDAACKKLGGWRLWQCELYVTLEPCPMCTGAVINSRIPRLVFGAYDKESGSCGSIADLFAFPYYHKADVTGGVLEDECAQLLSDFFKELRVKKQMIKQLKIPPTA